MTFSRYVTVTIVFLVTVSFFVTVINHNYVKDNVRGVYKCFKKHYYHFYDQICYSVGIKKLSSNVPFNDPTGIYVDSLGNVFVSERRNHLVRKISKGAISIVAGNGRQGFSGDEDRANLVRLSQPEGLTGDSRGNLFVADSYNHRIRRISPEGIITTIAGTGQPGYSGDSGNAVEAKLNAPMDLCMDLRGDFYIADWGNHRIRRISREGIITTIAGTGEPGFSGDGGPAIKARLKKPYGIAIDRIGNIYVADSGNHRVRKVSTNGIINTIAGTGIAGFSGDDGIASQAQLDSPQAVFVSPSNEIFINDEHNHRIRKILPSAIIQTVVGNGRPGFSGDGGLATNASINDPEHLWVDASSNIFFTDGDNNRVGKVDANGIITTITGGNY